VNKIKYEGVSWTHWLRAGSSGNFCSDTWLLVYV